LDSAHFSLQEKNNYLEWTPLETSQIKKTLSYIKAIEKMHQKLRHQLKYIRYLEVIKQEKTLHPFNPFFLLKKKNKVAFKIKKVGLTKHIW